MKRCLSSLPRTPLLCLSIALLAASLDYSRPVSTPSKAQHTAYQENPVAFLSQIPDAPPVSDPIVRDALACDFRKWVKWVINGSYWPTLDSPHDSMRLYRSSPATGGADIAYLKYTLKGLDITISQSVSHFCLTIRGIDPPKRQEHEQVELAVREYLSDFIRPDILAEVSHPSVLNDGDIWSICPDFSLQGFLRSEPPTFCIAIAKTHLTCYLCGPYLLPPDDWFYVTLQKVSHGSSDMADLPRLVSYEEAHDYFQEHIGCRCCCPNQ